MRLHEIPEQSRPRERLLSNGQEALSEAELLAIILQKGTKKENVVDMCNRLLSKYNLDKLAGLSLTELEEISGIGPAKAMQILAVFELNSRYNSIKNPVEVIRRAKDVYTVMSFLKNKKKEHLYGLFLDTKNQVIEKPELISIGILDMSLIHPREVFKEAIRKSAKSFILVHNHPSGNTNPSNEDIKMTKNISDAAEILDINMLDHIIIGDGYYSFMENNLIR